MSEIFIRNTYLDNLPLFTWIYDEILENTYQSKWIILKIYNYGLRAYVRMQSHMPRYIQEGIFGDEFGERNFHETIIASIMLIIIL